LNPHYCDDIPSFIEAQRSAQIGIVYCWLCASPNWWKHGGHGGKFEFKCQDCNQYYTYKMPLAVYFALKDGRIGKKYAPRKKLLITNS